ncbi:hypothetical protein [Rhizobium leguminosarum]|uniref:hypothetical protein n=1 Tax=Rhizobium leguminosarum TaxID=384 RepID=UPI00103D118E|nr:hypothetical protein [Rhizobium leguminosarum]TCA02553.1 hypothetical protein E0H57_20605 [Rhizobium leguminosarum bv. viciae]
MLFTITKVIIQVSTASGIFGAELPLEVGLNIVKAPNTFGKSTCLQALLYGLGLERMLGPRVETPFGHALKEYIREIPEGATFSVLSSFVQIELRNNRNETLAIHREVKGDSDRRLVRARIVDGSGSETRRDFFLHDPGSAQREDGFHHFLCSFIGWELPDVSTFDGREVPLYLAAIFPMLFVEQKRGWSAIQGPFPTFLKIQDIPRRVMEYLLDLDVGTRRRRRLELQKQISSLETEWSQARQHLISRLGNLSRLQNIPASPPKDFASAPAIEIEVYLDDEWVALEIATEHIKAEVQELETTDLQITEDVVPSLQFELAEAQASVTAIELRVDELRGSMAILREEIHASRSRVQALEVDLARNQDAQKLEKFGSRLGRAASEHTCPTCHQELDAELLPVVQVKGMAVGENIRFIKSQIDLYNASAEASETEAKSLQLMYESLSTELRDKLGRVRELGEALRRPSGSPTRSLLEKLVRLQARSRRYESMQSEADGMADRFAAIATAIEALRPQLLALKGDEFSEDDEAKIKLFEQRLQLRLRDFSFKTFGASEIHISQEDFRPIAIIRDKNGELVTRELGFEMSGSDAIRMKWSYYLALLDVGIMSKTNHPCFAAFDEPDQQAIESKDVKKFLDEAAKFGPKAQIVVAATAEKISSFDAELVASGANLISFDGYSIQRI